MTTIFALSSGQPPAGIAVVRISGPMARLALERLAGRVPAPRRAVLASLRDGDEVLDQGLILFFPGPHSATGEDLAELHLHGGRAVVDGVLQALSRVPGLRAAEPGEFTRRALENGRLDLAEAEGLADLLEAETASQRRAALLLSGGALGHAVGRWNARLLALAAEVETLLDFADEGDVPGGLSPGWEQDRTALEAELREWLSRPPAERLREGVRVVISGPPNAGKSTLLNALAGRSAAITSAIPGTTRDLIEVPVAIEGIPFLLVDSAGLRDTDDEVEALGIGRAEAAMKEADIVLWLGSPKLPTTHPQAILVHAKSDLRSVSPNDHIAVSATTGDGVAQLVSLLAARATKLLPRDGEVALNRRHRDVLARASSAVIDSAKTCDLLLVAEDLRRARVALDELTGRSGVEAMLDTLFSRFCIGK